MAIGDWFGGRAAPPPAPSQANTWMDGVITDSRMMQELNNMLGMQSQANMGMAGAANVSRPYSPQEKLLMRLNLRPGDVMPFRHMAAIDNPDGENVVVFIIHNGKPLVFEDDKVLFPTDGLIGLINMLR